MDHTSLCDHATAVSEQLTGTWVRGYRSERNQASAVVATVSQLRRFEDEQDEDDDTPPYESMAELAARIA